MREMRTRWSLFRLRRAACRSGYLNALLVLAVLQNPPATKAAGRQNAHTYTITGALKASPIFQGVQFLVLSDQSGKDIHIEATAATQFVNADPDSVRHNPDGSIALPSLRPGVKLTVVYADTPDGMLAARKVTFIRDGQPLAQMATRRIEPMPKQNMGEPYENFARRLIVWKLHTLWDFGTDGCLGAQIRGVNAYPFEQIRGLKEDRLELLPPNQADLLNGLKFQARFTYSAPATRYFDNYHFQPGQWQPWAAGLGDGMPAMAGLQHQQFQMFVVLRNDTWSADLGAVNMTYTRSPFPCSTMPH